MGAVAGSRNKSGSKVGYLNVAGLMSNMHIANRLASRHTGGEGGRTFASTVHG
ncbi:predicted protein [Pyrenophora tritici-repentis Pt-1C-BFP]|uniref:Uncharacterized protein n=1 Tax=Pyrenophora tritici-repentis (strain Pt-1C-BFP) TaxID=426418 RepID=B2W0Z9_PYRTR|nr:uncharacterized protein PTRG_04134 [Pyrenophora tritici-repentis Pt-1C-BFP]EDU46972.1 predicted protein [Pyrenophora tritici-repentis Pt-1C-BFP]